MASRLLAAPVEGEQDVLEVRNSHEPQNRFRRIRSADGRLRRWLGRFAARERSSWSFVILQAQKYSTSGQFTYSTAEAKELIRISREQRAVPVMFPEWPRRDIDETLRIFDLHVSIAQAEPACVAPVGQAWDLALARDPTLTLHAPDGNHSATAGAFLAALVLYATITGASPLTVPPMPQYSVDVALQETLRGIAAETVQTVPPRMWCPGDVLQMQKAIAVRAVTPA